MHRYYPDYKWCAGAVRAYLQEDVKVSEVILQYIYEHVLMVGYKSGNY